eukprot:485673_1
MTALKSTDIERTKEDIINKSRRYIVECQKKMTQIGIAFKGVNIVQVINSDAAKAFLVPSRIIRINDTIFAPNTSGNVVFQSVKFAREHPGSILELECNDKLYQKGIHFQLNINILSKYSVERVL